MSATERDEEVAEMRSRTAVDDSGCWIWQGCRNHAGYGTYGRGGKAHRVMYELVRGPIPTGHEIDHLCNNPPCINPNHLEAVTRLEHAKRTRERQGKNDLHRAAAEMRRRGVSLRIIAQELGFKSDASAWSAIEYAIQKGLVDDDVRPPKPRRYSDEESAEIFALSGSGLSYGRIAKRYGTTAGVIRKIVLRVQRGQEAAA